MSRIMEWVEREESLINSYIRAAKDRIVKCQKEVLEAMSEQASYESDHASLMKVKEMLQKMEETNDTTR
jgi:hypothetical protein